MKYKSYRVPTGKSTLDIVIEIFWVAWQAAYNGPHGIGSNPDATREDVIHNIANSYDYPINHSMNDDGSLMADFVFGRPVKFCVNWDKHKGIVQVPDREPDIKQGWKEVFPSYNSLVEQACDNLGIIPE